MTTVLRRVREQRGLSLRALADDVGGISHAALSRLEQGHQRGCHPHHRVAIERALGMPLDVLLMPDMTSAAASNGDDGAKSLHAANHERGAS